MPHSFHGLSLVQDRLWVQNCLSQFTKTSGLPEAVVSVSGPRTAENDIAGVVAFAAGHRLFDPVSRVFTGWLAKARVEPLFDALPLICVVE